MLDHYRTALHDPKRVNMELIGHISYISRISAFLEKFMSQVNVSSGETLA